MMNVAHPAGPVPRQPASQSRVSGRKKICKTFAERKYGLREEDLRHLDFIQTHSNHIVNHHPTRMYLYWERDVEGAAWRRRGGRHEFEQYLRKRREDYRRKFPDRAFSLFPKAYEGVLLQETPPPALPAPAPAEHPAPVEDPMLAQAHPEPVDDPVLVQHPPPVPNRARRAHGGVTRVAHGPANQNSAGGGWELALRGKASGDPWLFRACDQAIREVLGRGTTDRSWEAYIGIAHRDLPKYPQRIGHPSVEITAFFTLDRLLSASPKLDDPNPKSNIRLAWKNTAQGDVFYWSEWWLRRVLKALIRVVDEHGLGPQGWEAARWMVYDAFSKSVGGVKFVEKDDRSCSAVDTGYFWLIGQVPEHDLHHLPFFENRLPPLWREYNTRLPLTI